MYNNIVKYIKFCEECQFSTWIWQEEPLYQTQSIIFSKKVRIDMVYMLVEIFRLEAAAGAGSGGAGNYGQAL